MAAGNSPGNADAVPVPSSPSMVAGESSLKAAVRRRNAGEVAKSASVVGGDNAGSVREVSHSIRTDSGVEKPGELSQVKKHFESTIAYRRRKAILKPERPRWKTVLSVVTKNIVLIVVLCWLGQMAWKWFGNRDVGSVVLIGASDFERRMAEVEEFWKRTATMLQVQVDAVDKKIDNKVGNLKGELSKKLDGKSVYLEGEIKKLKARNDGLDKSLAENKDMGFFSKEELAKFFDEMKKAKGLDKGDMDFSLDEIKAYAREIVEKEIAKHAADRLGRVDYALGSGGAKVLGHSEPYVWKGSSWLSNLRPKVHGSAKKVLEPSFGEPGQCFALKGSEGFVEIRLRTAIIPEAITLEHVAKSVAYDRTSAPKDCIISGWYEDYLAGSAVEKSVLAEFTYDLEKSSAQTFNVNSPEGGLPINTVRLDFTSNHGSSSHTCIYRLRVHGHEPASLKALPI